MFIALVGWVLPLLLSIYTLLSWAHSEVQPRLYDTDAMVINSFPFLPFAWSCFELAAAWFFIAAIGVLVWLLRRRHP